MALGQLPTRKQILTNFAALLSGMGLARVMTAAALILVARQVGPGSYGQYVACFSLAKLTSVAFSWGLDGWLLWRGGAATNLRIVAVQSGVALTWKLLLGGLWFLALYLAADWLNPEVFPPTILLTASLIVWADDLTNTVWSVFKSTLKNDVTFKIITSVQLLLVLVTVALIFANVQVLIAFLAARLVVTAIGCIGAVYLLYRTIGIGFAASMMMPTLRAATPFAASLVFSLIYERADVAIIGQFLGKEQAGLYGPAATIATSLFLIPASAYAVMVPVFTRAHAGQSRQFQKVYRLFLAINTALGVCLAASLALAADSIMYLLYGAQYVASGGVLAILALVLGLRCVTFALGAAVVGTGLQTRRLKAQALAATLNVVINLMIVGAWGIRGVAWVYVFTEWVLLIGYWIVLAPVRSGPGQESPAQ
jgi:O-antigen/teichoic acid export membrane protein